MRVNSPLKAITVTWARAVGGAKEDGGDVKGEVERVSGSDR